MVASEERKTMRQRLARMRPSQGGQSWPLVVITVAVVLFMVLYLWTTVMGADGSGERATDHEVVHRLAATWKDRWAQAPGPPERYLIQAEKAERANRGSQAVERLTMSLALRPNDNEVLLRLVCASVRHETAEMALSAIEARSVVGVIRQIDPSHPILPAARGWLALQADLPKEVDERLRDEVATVEGEWARLRAAMVLNDEVTRYATRLWLLDQGNPDACPLLARAAYQAGNLRKAEQVVRTCREAGADLTSLARIQADVHDVLGRYPDAVNAYRRAGANVHALAIGVQEGLMVDQSLRDAVWADLGPAALLHQLWIGILEKDVVGASKSAVDVEALEGEVPEYRLALATADLLFARPAKALSRLEGMEGADVSLLAARALLDLGQVSQAQVRYDRALELAPWNVWVHRERMAGLARIDPAHVNVALDDLIGMDPHVIMAGRSHRRRDVPWSALAPSGWPLEHISPADQHLIGLIDGEEVAFRGIANAFRRGAGDVRALPWMAVHLHPPTVSSHWVHALKAETKGGDPRILVAAASVAFAQGGEEVEQGSVWLARARALEPGSVGVMVVRAQNLKILGEDREADALLLEGFASMRHLTGLGRRLYWLGAQTQAP